MIIARNGEFHYAEIRFAEFHLAEIRFVEFHLAEFYSAETPKRRISKRGISFGRKILCNFFFL